MAEAPDSSDIASSAGKRGQEFWAIAALGVTAIVCFSLMAIGLALIFSRGASAPSINNSTIVNAAPAPATANSGAGIQRPSEPAKAPSHPTLPGGALTVGNAGGGQRAVAMNRADPPSPPSSDPRRQFSRVRADPSSLYPDKRLPMRMPYAPDAHGSVAAIVDGQPGQTDERFSYAPDVSFAESGVRGQSLDLQLTQPRKTATMGGFRALKGFQFFSAKLRIVNQGAQPVVLHLDDLEVHDAEGVRYLANPELLVGTWPEPSLAPSTEFEVELSFLVPEESPLKELAVQEAPGQTALVPLQAR
jgi:hypothetical protein